VGLVAFQQRRVYEGMCADYVQSSLPSCQRADPIRSKDLIKTDANHVQARLIEGYLVLAESLHPVAVEQERQRPTLSQSPHPSSYVYQRLPVVRPRFVVYRHNSDQYGVLLDSG
jgi:hypothetical protein